MNNLYTRIPLKPSKILKTLIQNHINPFCTSYYSTSNEQQNKNESDSKKNDKELSKPSQIPYQTKVANYVNLIGTITKPIKFITCANGTSWAATILSQPQQQSDLPLLGVPVIFRGDLAYTAMMHLKENDKVYIAGHLSPEPLPIDLTNKANIQVLVHDVHFVRGLSGPTKKTPKSASGKKKKSPK